MASSNSRVKNTFLNFTSSIGGYFLILIMRFVIRTVFIRTLGKEYLGIEGLFTNILDLLSLVELGVGSAIIYKLYEPLASADHHRTTILMNFYKSVYRVIGLVVALMGCILIPFLPRLINDYDKLEKLGINAVIIFVFYLMKTVASYLFFAYKSAIIKASQKEYLINIIGYAFTLGMGIVQIICLMVFRKFELYVLVTVGQIILQNLACALLSDRMFPYIREHTDEKLSKEEQKEVFKDCAALLLYKLNAVVIKATDNVVLSIFMGLETVALYSNYLIFYSAISSMFKKIFNAVSHSLGNLHTTHNLEHEYEVFESVNLISAILGGTACVGIFCVADELILTWIGREWILQQPFSLLLGLEIYTLCLRVALSKYRTTMGLFQQAKFRPMASMIINLALSIWLVNSLGIVGVLIGTVTADWTTFMWFDPLIIHKYGFNRKFSSLRYFKKLIKQIFIISVVGCIDYMVCRNFFVEHGWFSVIIHVCICGITVPGALIVTHINSAEGKYVSKLLKKFLYRIKKN